jgi:hypothetical protein
VGGTLRIFFEFSNIHVQVRVAAPKTHFQVSIFIAWGRFPIEFPANFAYAKDADEFVRQSFPCAHRLAERGVGS